MTADTQGEARTVDTLNMNTRNAYSVEQLRACLFAAEMRYELASPLSAGFWLRSVHKLRDRIAFAEHLARVSK